MIEAIVRDVNCAGASPSELAIRFNSAFPDNERAFRNEFDLGNVEPARLFVVDRGEHLAPRFVFNLPTRIHWKAAVKPEILDAGIHSIVEAAISRQVQLLKIHRFEESTGSFSWSEIKLAFLTSLARIPDIRVQFLDGGMNEEPRKQVTIFTDGGAEPNPGTGGYGVVLRFGETKKELMQGFVQSTNNRMELLAAIVGLESLKVPCSVRLHSDSRYIVDAVSTGAVFRWREKEWKNGRVKNIDLWERFVQAFVNHQVEMVWVKGHAGIADNERCDQLATQAIASKDLQIDEGYLIEVQNESTGVQKQTGSDTQAETQKRLKIVNNSSTAGPDNGSVSKRGPKPKKIGDPCRHCQLPLVRRETKKSNPNSSYYFPWHLHCPNCDRIYHVESAKVYRKSK